MKKYKICYYENGGKDYEQFYDEDGKGHREDYKPDFQSWYNNGMLWRKTYMIHDKFHNINGPADICFYEDGKIENKYYCINDRYFSDKLNWQNNIKNI